jgi:hypothetical protein
MDNSDWFLPRHIQSSTNPPKRVLERARRTGAHGDAAAAAQRAISNSVMLDAVEEESDSVEDGKDAVEEMSDVDEVVKCPRCYTFHAGGVFREACSKITATLTGVPVVAFYMKTMTSSHKFSKT